MKKWIVICACIALNVSSPYSNGQTRHADGTGSTRAEACDAARAQGSAPDVPTDPSSLGKASYGGGHPTWQCSVEVAYDGTSQTFWKELNGTGFNQAQACAAAKGEALAPYVLNVYGAVRSYDSCDCSEQIGGHFFCGVVAWFTRK